MYIHVCIYVWTIYLPTYPPTYVLIYLPLYPIHPAPSLLTGNIIKPLDLTWKSHLLIYTFINFLSISFFYTLGASGSMKIRRKKNTESCNVTRLVASLQLLKSVQVVTP